MKKWKIVILSLLISVATEVAPMVKVDQIRPLSGEFVDKPSENSSESHKSPTPSGGAAGFTTQVGTTSIAGVQGEGTSYITENLPSWRGGQVEIFKVKPEENRS